MHNVLAYGKFCKDLFSVKKKVHILSETIEQPIWVGLGHTHTTSQPHAYEHFNPKMLKSLCNTNKY